MPLAFFFLAHAVFAQQPAPILPVPKLTLGDIRQLREERETSIGLARRQQSLKDAQSFRSLWKTSFAVILTALLISPLYWVLVGSFMTQRELFSPGFHIWPKEVAWDNWLHAFVRLWPHVQSSTIVSLSTTILTLFIAVPAAYTAAIASIIVLLIGINYLFRLLLQRGRS